MKIENKIQFCLLYNFEIIDFDLSLQFTKYSALIFSSQSFSCRPFDLFQILSNLKPNYIMFILLCVIKGLIRIRSTPTLVFFLNLLIFSRVATDTDFAGYPANIFTVYPVSGRITGMAGYSVSG